MRAWTCSGCGGDHRRVKPAGKLEVGDVVAADSTSADPTFGTVAAVGVMADDGQIPVRFTGDRVPRKALLLSPDDTVTVLVACLDHRGAVA
jgi:hypothetical protein